MNMLLSLWGKFKQWVTVQWSELTFIITISVLGCIALLLLVSFLKTNYNKGKSIKWGNLVLLILVLGIVAVLCVARYA